MVNACFGIIRNPLLEKVGLSLQRDHVHEVKGVRLVVVLLVTQCDEETISDELDILAHQISVHANQLAWEGICEELLFDANGFSDDTFNSFGMGAALQVAEEETGEVGVHTLIAGDEFVGESETRHKPTLLEPENGCKRTREEDTLDGGECNQSLAEACMLVGNPCKGPIRLALNARNCLDGVEKVVSLNGVFDIGVDEEGISFRVNILHHDLETIEAAGLSSLYFVRESLNQIFVDNAIGGGEEREDVRNKVTLVVVKAVIPVMHVLGEVHLLGSPK